MRTQLLADIDAAFRSSEIFKKLPGEMIALMTQYGSRRSLNVGQYLFLQGDPSDHLYCVMEGEVEICLKSRGGKEVHLAFIPAGALIGELGVVDGSPRSADAIAARRTTLLSFPRASVLSLLKDDSEACVAVIEMLAQRLRAADEQIRQFAISSIDARLAHLLLVNSNNGRKPVGLSQSEIARRLGARRETVNRKLGEWRREGILTISQVGVRVVSVEKLVSAIREDEDS